MPSKRHRELRSDGPVGGGRVRACVRRAGREPDSAIAPCFPAGLQRGIVGWREPLAAPEAEICFVTPPIDRGAEIRCYMRDPDGYMIEVGQATGVLHGELAKKRPEDLPG
jgi:hypothetical protein